MNVRALRHGMRVAMKSLLLHLGPSSEGATIVEYGLILGLIAIVCLVAVALLGDNLNAFFTSFAPQI